MFQELTIFYKRFKMRDFYKIDKQSYESVITGNSRWVPRLSEL